MYNLFAYSYKLLALIVHRKNLYAYSERFFYFDIYVLGENNIKLQSGESFIFVYSSERVRYVRVSSESYFR